MICKKCGDRHHIPLSETTPEMCRCPICLEYRPLYPVKRQAPEVSPWVLVEDEKPEVEQLVLIINRRGGGVRLGKRGSSGVWFLRTGMTMTPWMWCPIPPLPEIWD